ncbi:cadmium resistance transporter [Alkalinema sp. FACHB-956]|uniref:cadmium resistance transporter n=1 Tax=Alkalinema sp. FACHB-956 TaxID=2692768 RepID=UPI001683E96D|nr:cadmium resistance transporter [Alkalinema sp. FACHB-956]MBD2330009.1 cadmium resistance transporter [Alkalinema sp. FACHB-956]
MNWLEGALMTGVAAAFATTFDDNIYLTLFFSKVDRSFQPRHVVIGEYVGFTVLVGVSLVGFLGRLVIPEIWIGLLGLLPVMIGISQLATLSQQDQHTIQTVSSPPQLRSEKSHRSLPSLWKTLHDRQTYQVSAVTITNGGNNIGIYVPLFAGSTLPHLGIILSVCYATVGLWCFLSYHLTRQPKIAFAAARYARKIFPFILMWLGMRILIDNESYRLLFAMN